MIKLEYPFKTKIFLYEIIILLVCKMKLFLLNISLVQKFRYPLFSVIIVLPILPYRCYFLLSFEEKF